MAHTPIPDLAAIEVATLREPARDLKSLAASDQLSILQQRAEKLVSPAELGKRLTESKRSGKPLRIKFGIDPTAPELHLGHAVPLRLLSLFQRMGHKIVLIFGDFTATVGDPSGRNKERPVLTAAQVKANVRRYEKQAALFLDVGKAEVRFNREWHGHLKMDELFGYLRLQTVAQAMEREDFRARSSVTRAELLYGTLQAIDSVKVGADVEVGGQDQLLNLLEGRELMSRLDLTAQTVFTVPLLPGTGGTGAKMSKSKANFVAVESDATDIYGKVMAVADKDLPTYLRLLTDVDAKARNQLDHALKSRTLNPKAIKQLLARLVTHLMHPSDKEVDGAESAWEKTFSRHEGPTDAPTVTLNRKDVKDLADLVAATKLVASRSEAKRLVASGSISMQQSESGVWKKVSSLDDVPKSGGLLQVGKRRFVQLAWR